MVGLIDHKAYQGQLERLYEDTVSAFVTRSVKDPKTKAQKTVKEQVVFGEPCLLSFNSETHTGSNIGYTTVSRSDCITTGPDVDIPVGSLVIVTKSTGDEYVYYISDKPSIHPSHRRYALSLSEVS